MGGPARPLHEPGNHRSSERCSHRHSADRGSLIGQPTLLRITAPTPRPGARSVLSEKIRKLGDTFGREISWSGTPDDPAPVTGQLQNGARPTSYHAVGTRYRQAAQKPPVDERTGPEACVLAVPRDQAAHPQGPLATNGRQAKNNAGALRPLDDRPPQNHQLAPPFENQGLTRQIFPTIGTQANQLRP